MRSTLVVLLALAGAARADVRLPAIFSDHMVLQQNAGAPIWGWADPGEEVVVRATWVNGPIGARADDSGRWRATINTPGASGPFTITVVGKSTVTLDDVMIGEVWLCSGQSNMEWPLGAAQGGPEEAGAADHPRLRLFNVENTVAASERDDCRGRWAVCSPGAAGRFSAVAYFFARRLQTELGGVPIGLIQSDWGGTPAEAWTSAGGLSAFPEFADGLKAVARMGARGPESEADRARELERWRASIDEKDAGIAGKWMSPDTDASSWEPLPVPGQWPGALGSFDGILWTRTEFELPGAWAGRDLVLETGGIDDTDDAYVNGTRIGGRWDAAAYDEPRRYVVPGPLVRAGRNTLVVRILDTGGPGGVSDPVRLRLDGQPARSLAGEWRCRVGASIADLPRRPASRDLSPGMPGVLFNGMIAPLAGYGLRGAIWYQGEANVGRAERYRALFPAMIADWRTRWGAAFPFYYVQIAPFGYQDDRGQAAALREAQLLALATPGTGMAVTMDIGDARDIHPRNKRDVGHRLALWALAGTYGKLGVECSGPVYRGMAVEGNRIRLHFDHAAGLAARSGALLNFTIAGADRAFVAAVATIERDSVVVTSPAVGAPAAVRYCWGAADEGTLVNGAGLPASSFRTDEWPAVAGR